MLKCYSNIKRTNNQPGLIKVYEEGKTQKKPSWYNTYDFEEVKNNIKQTILSIIASDKSKKILGFKEIRYHQNTYLIDEFMELFPNTKVICHIDDNLDRQTQSSWWGEYPKSRKILEDYNNELITYSKSNKKCYLSYMKNLCNIDEVKKIFNFLNHKFDEKKYNYIINNSLEQ